MDSTLMFASDSLRDPNEGGLRPVEGRAAEAGFSDFVPDPAWMVAFSDLAPEIADRGGFSFLRAVLD